MNGITEMNGTEKRRLNQFGDYEDVTNMTVDDWEYRWKLEQTQFHVQRVHPMLQKHLEKLTQGKIRQRIFLPLCGKSIDIKWLSDQGHEVVGNEAVAMGCQQFFEEQNIPYKIEPLNDINGDVYKATDGSSITLYRCDFFDMSRDLCGQFDAVWDRGSFVAIPVADRKRYATKIQSLLKDDSRYLLDCFLIDNDVFGGPPFNCEEEDVKKNFGEICSVKKVDIKDVFGKWQESWGVKSFFEEVYFLEPK